MPVPNSAAHEAEGLDGPHLVTEAEALCGALCDMGLSPAVNFGDDSLYVRLLRETGFKPGALDLLKLVSDRASDDTQFREDMIDAVSHLGEYLAPAPAIVATLKTAPALAVIQALATSGLLVRHHYERNDEQTAMLSFMPVPGQPVAPNAHMLMTLAIDRFHLEPEFAVAMTRYVVNAGRSQHNA